MSEPSVAQRAEVIVEARESKYGHPADNHACTAAMWNAYLYRRYGTALGLDARDVCWLNVLQKISRDAHTRQDDNLLDVVGFVINIERAEGRG